MEGLVLSSKAGKRLSHLTIVLNKAPVEITEIKK